MRALRLAEAAPLARGHYRRPRPVAAKALSIAEQAPVDLALLDINLDGQGVWEVADALASRDIPVVFVTGYARWSIPDKYVDVPLCEKPVATAKVVEALERAAGR